MTQPIASTGALDGIVVLDLTQVMAGPYATRMLADLGATVIKIEPPGGEQGRGGPPMRGGISTVFVQLNAGKRSLMLDLKDPADVATLRHLAESADVLVENYRPGVLDRLGVGHAALSAINPRLISCSISGFRPDGPLADDPSYAPVMHALCGYDLVQLSYQDGMDRPANTGMFAADVVAGTNAVIAVLAALTERARTGLGQHVGTTLFSTMLGLMVREVHDAQVPSAPRRHLYKPIVTQDGFVIVMPLSDRHIRALAEVIGMPELLNDPRFVTAVQRTRNWDAMMAPVEEWARVRGSAECERLLLAAEIPAARYRTIREVLADPRFAVDAGLVPVGEGETMVSVTPVPVWMERTPPRPGAAPELDEFRAEISRLK